MSRSSAQDGGSGEALRCTLRFKHIFAFTTRQHRLPLMLGIVASILVGALSTALSIIVGQIFNVISRYSRGGLSDSDAMAEISTWCRNLVIAGTLGCLINFASIYFWSRFGEIQARLVRSQIFLGLLHRGMGWYDLQPNGISSLLVKTQT